MYADILLLRSTAVSRVSLCINKLLNKVILCYATTFGLRYGLESAV
jgi:hypothetical protein